MKLTRRGFLGALIAASSLAAIGGAPLVKDGLRGDTYYMTESEVLDGLNVPSWAKIVMADNTVINECIFIGTQIYVPIGTKNASITKCHFDGTGLSPIPSLIIFEVEPTVHNVMIAENSALWSVNA